MTYEQDPARWSDTGNPDVPDVLRDLMQAGAQEVPSAAKLAALSAKVSAGATAGTAASATTSGVLGTAKLWVAGAAISAAVVGAVALQAARPSGDAPGSAPMARPAATESASATPAAAPTAKSPVAPEARLAAPAPAPAADRATPPMVAEPGAPEETKQNVVAPQEPGQVAGVPDTQTAKAAGTGSAELGARPALDATAAGRSAAASSRAGASRRAERTAQPTASRTAANDEPSPVTKKPAAARAGSTPSDVQLLLEARNALTSSPQRALTLATRHAAAYPDSQFRQERDALVIEALTRSGQLARAREEARSFVRRYPNSANAHRFRERLEL